MKYFDKDFAAFFKELEKNNNKEWFHSQKKRYEQSVKHPFQQFITDLIEAIQQYDDRVRIEAKDCILRVNRDIRFSKDKSPYNLHVTAIVSIVGRKDKSIPGIFLRFAPKMIGIMGGCYGLDKQQLANIRKGLAKDGDDFRKLISAKDFVSKFENIRGDVIKRIPKELQEDASNEPLILNKQFYFAAERDSKLLTSKNLLEEIMTYWKAAQPVNDYLYNCIK